MRQVPSADSERARALPRWFAALLAAGLVVQGCVSTSASPYPDRVRIPTPSAPAAGPEAESPGSATRADGGYLLPARRCGDFFLVDAHLNGKGPFPLILDSGAGRTVLDPSVLEAVGAEGSLDSLRVGEFEAHGLSVSPLEMADLSRALREPVMGIVGHPVFAGGTITYDYPRGEIRLSRSPLLPGEPGVVRARESSRPWVVGEAEGRRFWVLLDTGSSRGLSLVDLDSWTGEGEPVVTGASMRVDGLHLNHSLRLSDTVRVGPLVLDRPVVGSSVSVNLLGQEFLHHFAVTFDARNDLVRFDREDAGIEAPLSSPPLLGTGLTIRPLDDVQLVMSVLSESPAARAGLQVGDTIVAVDGVPVEDLTCRDPWAERTREPTPVLLSVREGGEVREISVARVVVVR